MPFPDWLTRNNTKYYYPYFAAYSKHQGEAVVLHSTAIAIHFHQGDNAGYVRINSGGWRTVTTKARINQCLLRWAPQFRVYSLEGAWWVQDVLHNSRTQFIDGMLLPAVIEKRNVSDDFPFTTEE